MNTSTPTKQEAKSDFLGIFGSYNLIKPLGDSHLFPVYLAQHQDSTETVVLKYMSVKDESFANEMEVFKMPEHPRIVKCKDTLSNLSVEFGAESKSANKILLTENEKGPSNAMVLELAAHGDLFNYLIQGPLSENITRYYFEQVLDAIEHMHKNGFCHLDIKLENLLVSEDFGLKLTDFGFATRLDEGKKLLKKVGTPGCRPPEMWRFGSDYKGYDGAKADSFQLGVLLYILLTGMPPFSEAKISDPWYKPAYVGKWDVFWSFKERALKTRKGGPKSFSTKFKELITSMLCLDSEIRPTLQEIRESSWFTSTAPASHEEVLKEMSKRKEQIQ